MKSNKNPKFSVLIATYQEEKNILACLESLKNQTYKDFEIVICDAYSTDKTIAIARKYTKNIVMIKKSMIGIQKNAGVKACHGEYVILSDADCTHPKNWIENMAKFISKHPDIAVYGGIDIPRKNDPLFEKCVFAFDKNDETITDSNDAAWRLRGCNIVYKRKAFLKENGYDEELSGSEEPELHTRMAKKGYKLYFDKQIYVYHRRRGDIKSLFKQLFRNGVSSGKIFRKRFDMFKYYDILSIGYVLFSILALAAFFYSWIIGAAMILLAFIPILFYSTKAMLKSKTYRLDLLIAIMFTRSFAYGIGILYGYLGGKLFRRVKF